MALLKNNTIKEDGTIVRAIAFERGTMKPREVLRVIRVGEDDEIGTQQEVKRGDIVLMNTISKDLGTTLFPTMTSKIVTYTVKKVTREQTFMSKFTDDTLDMYGEPVHKTWKDLFKEVGPEVERWINNKDDSAFLPDGVGWKDGFARFETEKIERFKALFNEVQDERKNLIIDWAMFSPRENVNPRWKDASPLPKDSIYLPALKNVVGYFTILWTDFGVDFKIYEEEDYSVVGLTLDTLKNEAINRALVGTIVSNRYGKNVRWKLYS